MRDKHDITYRTAMTKREHISNSGLVGPNINMDFIDYVQATTFCFSFSVGRIFLFFIWN